VLLEVDEPPRRPAHDEALPQLRVLGDEPFVQGADRAARRQVDHAVRLHVRDHRDVLEDVRQGVRAATAAPIPGREDPEARAWGGRITPSESSPTPWPDRPIRWTRRETSRGELYCRTKSAVPTSMPSSRDDVHTSARRPPLLNSSSIWTRTSFDRLPWCTPIF